VHEVMHPTGPVVARRLERDAVRDVEVAEPFEQLRVPHCVLESDEHGPAFERRLDRTERGLGRLRFHQDDDRVESPWTHFHGARESRELRHRFRAARELQAVLPDRLDVRAVRVEHGDVGDFRQISRVEAAYRAGADYENALMFSHRMRCRIVYSSRPILSPLCGVGPRNRIK